MKKTKHTDDMLISDAKRFNTRSEWFYKSPATYRAAKRRKLLDLCCGHMTSGYVLKYTNEMLFADAKRFNTRSEWRGKSNAAYQVAKNRKLLDLCCSHMSSGFVLKYTNEMLFADAKRFATRKEWADKSPNAYVTACNRKILDECCSHMVDGTTVSDNDAIYIWRAVGMRFNGEKVYKIGVTSARLGRRRIKQVARESGIKCEMVVLQQVQGKATDLEKQLLVLGTDPEYTGFNGASEFRALSLSALETAIALIERAQASSSIEVLC